MGRYNGEPIKVVVGSSKRQQTFYVHKSLLEKHSEYFASALGKDWKEGPERCLLLADNDPDHFAIFTRFLYCGYIFTSHANDFQPKTEDRVTPHDYEWCRLFDAWKLGDMLLSTSFKDAIVDSVIEKMKSHGRYPLGLPASTYAHAQADCGMRRLCIDIVVWKFSNSELGQEPIHKDHVDFWFAVAVALHKVKRTGLTGESPFMSGDACIYHDHGTDGCCYRTMF